MKLTLDEIKLYLKVDHREEDDFISSLLIASRQYLINATSKEADETTELFKVAQRMLILHWYEHRSAVVVGTVSKALEFALESMILQIKVTAGDVS